MPVMNIAGWELNSIGEFAIGGGTYTIQSTVKRTGGYALRVHPTGANTGYNGMDLRIGPIVGGQNNTYWRFYMYVASGGFPGANDEPIFQVQTAGGAVKLEVRLNSSAQLAAYSSTPTLLATGTTALSAVTWYCIEVYCGTGASASWEVRINGTTEISGSGVNLNTTGASFGYIGKYLNRNSQGIDVYFDDWAGANDTWIGPGGIVEMLAAGDGTYAQWTAAGFADDYTDVDEPAASPDDTNYWQSTANGDQHSVTLEGCAAAGVSGTINAVKGWLRTARSGGSNGNVIARIRSNATNADGSGQATISAFNWRNSVVCGVDPATSAKWTISALDAAELIAVSNHAQQSRCSVAVVLVDFQPNRPLPPALLTVAAQRASLF